MQSKSISNPPVIYLFINRITSKAKKYSRLGRDIAITISFTTFLLLASFSYASQEAKKVLSLVDYIGSDYVNAIEGGKIINQAEYEEMLEFSSEALEVFSQVKPIAGENGKEIEENLRKLRAKIESRTPSEEIEMLSREIKNTMLSIFDIIPYPTTRPSFESGEEIYKAGCAACHGTLGMGNGPSAGNLTPSPSDFTDPEFMKGLSPFKAYNTASFGIANTAMPGFPTLSEKERWDVAFYVFSLRFNPEESEVGEKLLKEKSLPDDLKNLQTLASLSDGELIEKLKPYLENEGQIQIQSILAYLRRGVIETKELSEDFLFATASLLNKSMELYQNGEKKQAYDKAIEAYLEGFENVEPTLFSRDLGFSQALEAKLAKLRGYIKSERPPEEVKNLYEDVQSDLKRASFMLREGKPLGSTFSFINSFTIVVREGLEAVLIVAAIVASLGAMGAGGATRYIHLGWISALLVGLITWFLAQTVISISGAQKEIIEGVTALLAACVLFYVSYWLVTKLEVRKWKEFIERKLKKAISKKDILTLVGVSFFAVYREAFETVLFYQALWLQAEGSKEAVIWGFVLGCILLLALVFVIFRLRLRMPLKYFFSVTSLLLYFLAFMLAGKGIKELQGAGLVGITPIGSIPQVDILGIYPTLETTLIQGFLILALLGALAWIGFIKHKRGKRVFVTSVSHSHFDRALKDKRQKVGAEGKV